MDGQKAARDHHNELTGALNEMFYAVLQVDLVQDDVYILQSRDFPEKTNTSMRWEEYLRQYGRILTEEGRDKVCEKFSTKALLAAADSANGIFSLDVSYKKGVNTNWLTITASARRREDGSAYAYIFVRQNNEEHLLRSIIDLYVYSTCDYFIYLNARKNSYVMFSGNTAGTPLPPTVCDDYDAALVEYARNFVVPEDQEMTIREMRIGRVLEQLEKKGVHAFTTGVMEEGRGYTRKRLEYRYYDRDAQMILLVRTDVTDVYYENKQRSEALREALLLAERDSLTGILNYGALYERITRALEVGVTAALLFIDLDNFKTVNDTIGHQAGDDLLRSVAQVLRNQLWEKDLCGRVGGDEFVVFLPEMHSRDQAVYCARRLCECIERLSEEGKYAMSCSIGVAFAPEEGTDYNTLAHVADLRAYAAKAQGKNRYVAD